MAQSGWQFAADLSELQTVGAVDLPAMAYTFAALNNTIDRTRTYDVAGFTMEGAGGFDQVYPAWSQLRDALQTIFGKTAANIQTTGEVVVGVVQAYAATDTEAARTLQAAWQGGPPSLHDGEHPPPGPPPAVVLT
jgi:hypothetical protein